MSLDMHLKLEGGSVTFKGESKHAKHKDEIQVLAWSWGMSQSGSFGHGSGGGAGKANIQDISITKYIDKSSTAFIKALVTGSHMDTVTLSISKAGGSQEDYFTIKLTSAMVTSYSTGGSGGEDMLTENVSISFAKFDVEYFTQNDKGAVASAGKVGYSVEEMKAT
ncbi:Hcp family type VI secretion system effector [Rhodanobacter ginsengiterrae]|uniref:Hcp family type VI secretion system effector n=1 Tax=Rhodanobacter ginsengiterrae TaxID=2008451 RepID=UPI003CFB3964